MTGGLRSLTEQEARTRAALVSVGRYDIDVDLTGLLDGTTWRATSTVTFRCCSPGAETFVDCGGEVRSASLNGRPVAAQHIGEGRIRLTDLAEDNVLVVESTQDDTSSQRGVQRFVDPADGEVYVWTSFCPDDARMCWACFDQPDLKAPHAFSVLAPESWSVLSNRVAGSVTEEPHGRRWVFADTPPLSTYVVVVNAGPFHEVRSTRSGYDLGLFCRRSLAPVLDRDAEELLSLTEAGLSFYGDRFGQPFGQRKYDQMFVPDFGGAMENWGCVTISDAFLFRAAPTRRERAWRVEYVLHEMAHMWFGDLVTMRWWDDLWLNEAFASWAATWAAVQVTDLTDAWATFLTKDKIRAYAADRAVTSHPVRQPARDAAEGAASFDAITYVKGASVLKQLVALVGEEAFTEALRAYFAEHAWGSATLEDLMSSVGRAAGRDLTSWTAGWLDRAGADRIELERRPAGVTLHITSPDAEPPRPHQVAVGVYRPGEGGWVRTGLVAVETRGTRAELGVSVAGELLLANDEDLSYAVARPDPASRELLLTRSGELPTPMARALAVATAWDMLAHAEVSAADVVRCALAAARRETEPAVADDVLWLTRTAAEQWAPPHEREMLLGEVATLAAELTEVPDLRSTALRVLAQTASSEAHLGQVRAAAHTDTELGWALLVRLAELGRLDEAELHDLLARDPDPDARVRAREVRAALPERGAKEEAWRALFVDRTVPLDRTRELATAFWRPGQADLLREYTARYLEAITELDGGVFLVMEVASVFFPVPVGDEEFLAAVDRVAAGDRVDPVLRRVLLTRADALRRMLRARQA